MIADGQALETALVRLRDPLARVQLAASELDEASIGEWTRRCIEQAVAEIDLRIEDLLTGLRQAGREPATAADVRESLALVVRDLSPVLAARGIELALVPTPDTPVLGDASLVRRILCRLLLGISHWVRSRAAMARIELEDCERVRIALAIETLGDEPCDTSCDLLDPARELALGEGIRLESSEDPEAGRAVLVADFGSAP